jgi:ribosome-associated heat shock protein Hsp15
MDYRVSTEPDARVRVDKWLWAARFFKTRSLAADAIAKGRILVGGEHVKASRDLRVGDLVEIEIDRINWEIKVAGITGLRGPATVAQTLYSETEKSRTRRLAELERRRTYREPAAVLQGRPTKRDRRTIDKLSGGD